MDKDIPHLESKDGPTTMTWKIEGNHFVYGWIAGPSSSEEKVPLDSLRDEPAYYTGRGDKAISNLLGGLTMTIGTIVLCFAIFPELEGALSMTLGGFGVLVAALISLGYLIHGIQSFPRRSWTLFNLRDGTQVSWIRHDSCDQTQREQFEQQFREHVRAATAPGER